MRAFLLVPLYFLAVCGMLGAAPPNILIVLGDDIDRDSLGPWGGEALTPNLDTLAAEGVRLEHAYANVAMCAPFRQELYSGRTAWRTRAMPNHSRSTEGTKSLPHYLRPLGYKVGLLGKSHVGPREAYPFDQVGDLPMKQDANPIALQLASDYMMAARDAGSPFCLVVASHDGHGPYTHGDVDAYDQDALQLPDDAIDTPEYRRNLAQHYAEVTNLDALLGELRKFLAQSGLAENTLVIFCSEQGNAFPFGKWTCFDDGLGSGIVAALPGKIPAGTSCPQIAWIADLCPTLVEAAGGTFAEETFDGKSQWANFLGANKPMHRYAHGAFSNCNIIDNRDRIFPIRSIRVEHYTLVWSPRGAEEVTSNVTLTQALELIESGATRKGGADVAASWVLAADGDPDRQAIVQRLHHRPVWALYDRQADPEELINRVADPEMAPVLERLKTEMIAWLERWDDADPVVTEQGFVRRQ